MLEKVRTFFNQWVPFAIKREREPAVDDQAGNEPAASHNAPISKKLRLMSNDREQHSYKMASSKRDLEQGRDPASIKWAEVLKNSAVHTSTPTVPSNTLEPSRSKPSMSKTEVIRTSHSVKTMHLVLETVEDDGSCIKASTTSSLCTSLQQLEKLSKMENAAVVSPTKPALQTASSNAFIPKPAPGPLSTPFPNFLFTPLVSNGDRNDQSSVRPALPVIKSSRFTGGKIPPENVKRRITNGGIQKTPYKPLHQKMFGTPKNLKNPALFTSVLSKQSSNWAYNSCIRMEERQSYQALLAQFAPKGPKSSFGSLGRFASNFSLSPSTLNSSQVSPGILVEKIDTREAQQVQQQLKRAVSQVVDLENEPSSSGQASTASATGASPSPVPGQTPAIVRLNSLEDALALSPQYDAQFVTELKSRYNAKERELKRRMTEEETRLKILGENREAWEGDLENRLRRQLEIVTLKPVVDEREAEPIPVLPEITDDMQHTINRCLCGNNEGEVLCDAFNLTVTRRDLKTLAGLNWLNDQVINFYLTLIMERSKGSGDWPKVFAHNTFFYPKLMSAGHAGLKRWTRRVDLFQQDFILVPVHLGLHWCMAIVAPKEKAIRYYDSMGGRNLDCLKALKRYMEEESLDKKKATLDTSEWVLDCVQDIPQQMNGSDCGMFACKYAEYISRRAKITFDQKDMPYFRQRMVYEIVTKELIHP